MLHGSTPETTPASPLRAVRVLIEGTHLTDAVIERPVPGVDVTTCTGPTSDGDVCPLVMDGTCPHGRPDVVVAGLDGPWAPSVRAAWAELGVAVVDTAGLQGGDPAARLAHDVGAALRRLAPTDDCS